MTVLPTYLLIRSMWVGDYTSRVYGDKTELGEDVLLSGDYQKLLPCFQQMNVDQLVLEYATPRAGDIDVVGRALNDREIGLGVVNPRTDESETVGAIVEQVERALKH